MTAGWILQNIPCARRDPVPACRGSNVNAIRLYEQLGFRLRKSTVFSATRVPEAQHAAREPEPSGASPNG
jgi:hypothetical protein